MTRIFDALRKSQGTHPAPAAAPPAPAPAFHTTVGRASARHAAAAPEYPPHHAAGASARLTTLPYAGPTALPEDVVREMTSLRMSIESALADRPRRTIVFTSSLRGEGTSTVALQFALVLAREARHAVVLVDAHVAHPARHAAADHAAIGLHAAERATPGARPLHVLPLAESLEPGAALAPAAMSDTLERLAATHDWVVVDAPPAVESPEAPALAALADGVVVVVQVGRTKRPVLSRAIDRLRKAGARVLGTVLNRRRLEIPDFIYRRI